MNNLSKDPIKVKREYDIIFSSGDLVINKVLTGRYKGFLMEKRYKVIIDDYQSNSLVEKALSCCHKEFASSSPSMCMHQIVTLLLCEILIGKKQIEEMVTSNIRADLIWTPEDLNEMIYVEVTGNNFEQRFNKITSVKNVLVICKYFALENDQFLYRLSVQNDNHSLDYINEKLDEQFSSLNNKRLIDSEILEYFSNIPADHVLDAQSTFEIKMLNKIKNFVIIEDKDYKTQMIRLCN